MDDLFCFGFLNNYLVGFIVEVEEFVKIGRE
jgi:hypothetical protein